MTDSRRARAMSHRVVRAAVIAAGIAVAGCFGAAYAFAQASAEEREPSEPG